MTSESMSKNAIYYGHLETYIDSYGEWLPFSVLCRFLKAHKQYIFNKNIQRNACLYGICKNAVLLSKGVSSIALVKI